MRLTWVTPGPLAQPTGGYVYDRIVTEGLTCRGHIVRTHASDAIAKDALADAILADTPDVIVFDELAHRAFAASRAPLRRARIPVVLLVHHLGFWEKEASRTSRARLFASEVAALFSAEIVVAASPFVADRLAGLRTADAIVPPGADRLPRRTRTQRTEELRIVFVGSVVPRKRVLALLDAVDRGLLHAKVKLAIVGEARDEAYATAVRTRIARSDALARAVTLHGAANDDRLADVLAAADLLVLPSSLEGFGIVLAEALHAGVPVLAASSGGAPHAVAFAADAARVVAPAAIEDELRRIATDAALRERLEVAARGASERSPRWETTIAQFEEVVIGAARGSSPRGGCTR